MKIFCVRKSGRVALAFLLSALLVLTLFTPAAAYAEEAAGDTATPTEEVSGPATSEEGTPDEIDGPSVGEGLTALGVQTLAVEGDYTYTVSGGNATITAYAGTELNLVIPASLGGYPVTRLGDYAFANNTAIGSVRMQQPDYVTSIGTGAFSGCTNLYSISIPSGVSIIESYTFQGCTRMEYLGLLDNVTTIRSYAVSGCTALRGISIGGSITSIGTFAFAYCTSLQYIVVDYTNPNYSSDGTALYNKNKTVLLEYPAGKAGAYTIPNTVTSIGEGAFAGSASLTGITIPASVTSIGIRAFVDCTSLTSVTIPSGLTTIADYAFLNCSSLAKVYIPKSVTSIGVNGTFSGCTPLRIYCNSGSVAYTYAVSKSIPYTLIPNTTITLNPNGGTVSPNTIAVASGTPNAKLPTPTRTGHSFDGWFTAASGGTQYTDPYLYSLTSNTTLYAHWTPKEYTLFYNVNGGDTLSPSYKYVTYGQPYGTLATPTRTGYSFDGWYTAPTGGTLVTAATVHNFAGTATIYAHWSTASYTLTYNANGGNALSPSSKTVYYGAAYGTLPTPTRTGYDFAGWYTAASGGTQVTSTTVHLTYGNVTIYAHWTGKA
ncbi:MAG: leucine-rich repeat protein, partial [Clostridiales Family XIII bacterium]|nr:leucine-rich repeat protein [Clostridiales Family XIII bacterium]